MDGSTSKPGPLMTGKGSITLAIIGFFGALVLNDQEMPTALVWTVGVGACLPYLRYILKTVLLQDSLYDELYAHLSDQEPYAISEEEEEEPAVQSGSLWFTQRTTGRLDGHRVHIQMRLYGAEAWVDCAALPRDGALVAGQSGTVRTGDIAFDAEVGLEGNGPHWRALLSPSIRATLSEFLVAEGCRVACDVQRLRVRVQDDDLHRFEGRLRGAIRLAKALEEAHQKPLSDRLWHVFEQAKSAHVRTLLIRDLATLPSEHAEAIRRGGADDMLSVRLVAAELAKPPNIDFIRRTTLNPEVPASLRLSAIDALATVDPDASADVRQALFLLLDTDEPVLRSEAQGRLATLGGAIVGGLAVVASQEQPSGGLSVLNEGLGLEDEA